jgi:hypothetical protein
MTEQSFEQVKVVIHSQGEILNQVVQDNIQFLSDALFSGGEIGFIHRSDGGSIIPQNHYDYDSSSEFRLIYELGAANNNNNNIALLCQKNSNLSFLENSDPPTLVFPRLNQGPDVRDRYEIGIDSDEMKFVLPPYLWQNYRLLSHEEKQARNIIFPPEGCDNPPGANCVECAQDDGSCVPPMKLKSPEEMGDPELEWPDYFKCHEDSNNTFDTGLAISKG